MPPPPLRSFFEKTKHQMSGELPHAQHRAGLEEKQNDLRHASNELIGLHEQTWGTKRPSKEVTHVSQGLNAGSPLSLGRCAEPVWNRALAVQGAAANGSWTTELSVNKA